MVPADSYVEFNHRISSNSHEVIMLGLNLFRLDLISSVLLPLHNFSPRAPILLF